MADDYKYHIDHHGSLVRPAGLLAARAIGDAGALAAAETEAVAVVSHALRRLTLSAVGDGQFRREHFESVVYDHVDGFRPVTGTQPLTDAAGIPAARRRTAPDDPQATGRLAQAEVAPVLAAIDRPVFVQLPSPGYLAAVGSALDGAADVDAVRARGAALAAVLRTEIQALAAAGVAYVALGNPLYPPLLTVAGRERLTAAGLARRRRDAGTITADELRTVEDEAIAAAVKGQQDAGIDVITDGEFRRRDFRTGFVEAVDGMDMRSWDMPWQTSEGVTKLRSNAFVITGRLRQRSRLAAGEAACLTSLTSAPVKVTLIGPGFLVDKFWKDGVTDQVYESPEEVAAEVAAITRTEIEALIAEGVSYIQLDNPGYGSFVGAHAHGERAAFERMVDTDAAAVAGIERPDGVTIGLHVCRGNQSSMWMSEGDYQPIAERLFATVPVDRFLLEYDDDRAGGFDPLRFVPEGKIVVLGLVTSKSPVLEQGDELRRRVDEAAALVGLGNLALSPQCGFASIAEGGNHLTEDEQFAKLRLVADTARAIWG